MPFFIIQCSHRPREPVSIYQFQVLDIPFAPAIREKDDDLEIDIGMDRGIALYTTKEMLGYEIKPSRSSSAKILGP